MADGGGKKERMEEGGSNCNNNSRYCQIPCSQANPGVEQQQGATHRGKEGKLPFHTGRGEGKEEEEEEEEESPDNGGGPPDMPPPPASMGPL